MYLQCKMPTELEMIRLLQKQVYAGQTMRGGIPIVYDAAGLWVDVRSLVRAVNPELKKLKLP